PPPESPDRYIYLCNPRSPQLAAATTAWWLDERPFFDNLTRQRIWIFWRRVLHTCHHRTQVQSWLRLAGKHVPAIYGPSGDVKSSGDDPTYSIAAASRGAAEGTYRCQPSATTPNVSSISTSSAAPRTPRWPPGNTSARATRTRPTAPP